MFLSLLLTFTTYYVSLLITILCLIFTFLNIVIESNDNQHRNELVSFVGFEELLLKYFRNSDLFTVVPKIVYLDGDVNALNKFLMRARPSNLLLIKVWLHDIFKIFFTLLNQLQDKTKLLAVTMGFFIAT